MAQSRDFVLGMFVGAAVGAAVAILYAPQSGPETRVFLRQKAGEVKDRASDVVDTAKEKTTAVVDTAKTRAREAAEKVSTSAQQLVDTTKNTVQQQVSAVQAAVDAGKQAFTDKQQQLSQEVDEDVAGAASGATPATGAPTI
jgi:gas vesicle protein